jgi:hypothetical protein
MAALWHKQRFHASVLEALLNTRTNVPHTLHEQLTASWKKYGVPLTHYRDCIHHYVPVDFALASALMRRHSCSAWTTMIRIPDNPETRSKKNFSFNQNRDALTYSWEIADEILAASMATMRVAVPRNSEA